MTEFRSKNFANPDQTIRFPKLTAELVEIGELTVGYIVTEPGWRWSVDLRPLVGGEWCQARHVGVVLSGRVALQLRDGRRLDFGPNDVFDIPPGHDGWTVGDEPCVQIEWAGLHTFAGLGTGLRGRALVTLMFTDLVESTVKAREVGDTAWRELLTRHLEAVRTELDRFGGREVSTTGDGILAAFDGPARAVRAACAIRDSVRSLGLELRAGLHTGECELANGKVRGIAVHTGARVAALAESGEVLVSSTVRDLVAGSGIAFEERGEHELKGVPGTWRLYEVVSE
jgi:class 3 adenylate cyclase